MAASAAARGCGVGVSARRGTSGCRRTSCGVARAKKRGFGDAAEGGGGGQGVRLNKRGKEASGPTGSATQRQEAADYRAKLEQQQADALERARLDAAERRDAEREGLPQVVSDRMLSRIVTFSGVPLLAGFASGPALYYVKVVQKVDLAPAVAYAVTSSAFALALAGISYGVLSTSWDPRIEGSKLGLDEFKMNLPILSARLFNRDKK